MWEITILIRNPLVMTNVAIENGQWWIFDLNKVIFHSYLSLLEGKSW